MSSSEQNLASLKHYACFRYMHEKDWYLHCIGCSSLKNCTTGKKVVNILDQQTKSTNANEKTKRDVRPANIANAAIGRKNCREAIQRYLASDPERKHSLLDYLVTEGRSHELAKNTVKRWSKSYPDIFKENGVPTYVKGTSTEEIPMEKILEIFMSDDPAEFLAIEKGIERAVAYGRVYYYTRQHPEEAKKYHVMDKMKRIKDKGKHFGVIPKEKILEIFMSDDPAGFVAAENGIERTIAYRRLYHYIKQHPEEAEKYHVMDKMKKFSDKGKKDKEEKSMDIRDTEDEVSLDDFLDEMEVEPEAEPETEPPKTSDSVADQLYQAYDALAERQKILRKELEVVVEQMNALDFVMSDILHMKKV